VTFGLQIGGETAEVFMLAKNQEAIDALLSSSIKLVSKVVSNSGADELRSALEKARPDRGANELAPHPPGGMEMHH
jgi:hypothetical protein